MFCVVLCRVCFICCMLCCCLFALYCVVCLLWADVFVVIVYVRRFGCECILCVRDVVLCVCRLADAVIVVVVCFC